MNKIPTIYLRDEANPKYVTRDRHPRCDWVFGGEGVATRKYDGTCVMFDGQKWWARREVKPGKLAPAGFVAVETDTVTGKTVGWEPMDQSAFARWHAEAVDFGNATGISGWPRGTYELVGPKVNGNPERLKQHALWAHSAAEVEDPPRDFDRLAEWLSDFLGEGIVWHHADGRMAKIKRRDFPPRTGAATSTTAANGVGGPKLAPPAAPSPLPSGSEAVPLTYQMEQR